MSDLTTYVTGSAPIASDTMSGADADMAKVDPLSILLIVLLLLSEGDDLELVIALGLALMMGLGDGKKDSGT